MANKQINFNDITFTIHDGGVLFTCLSQTHDVDKFWENPLTAIDENTIVTQLNNSILKCHSHEVIATLKNIVEIDFSLWYYDHRVIKKLGFNILLRSSWHSASEGNFGTFIIHIFKETY